MFDVNTVAMFFTASVLLALAPGPDNLYVMTQSMLKGRTAGLMVTLGLSTGLIGHTSAVALGVAVLFQTSALAFTVLKLTGAAYLVYLAWKAFSAPGSTLNMQKSAEVSYWYLYRRGVIMNITNPKVSIFFLAFLPQFADPSRDPISMQLLLLGGVFIIATILVFGSIALLAGTLGRWLNRSPRVQNIMNRVAGIVFVCLALRLATTEQ